MSVAEGLYRVRNVGSGLLLEVYEGRAGSGVNVQQGVQEGSEGAARQLWRIMAVHEGSALHHIESLASGKRLDVAGASVEPGANVQQWGANNFGAQEWLLEGHVDAPGRYSLVSYVSGLPLEVAGASGEPGANVQQGEDTDTPAQWWTLEPARSPG
ncbi:RICIN domain-containing protein [Streptomyces sp. TRM 70351]|uniref:RICIN domain-containing protein n=1 Tax=Streptomyces sp. TRM 70351 TaxID=3116552 RepID=UPI002E7BDFBC|nr:RICIN domain-containing protein [Streptomyces sp. TRM 70351]MEE1929342.1 RICIN domain-containing protein [Streptomyces sp. TRM 70351]